MPLNFLLGVLTYAWELLAVQVINFEVLWQVIPVYICWFFTVFITRGKEFEDMANTFLNGFSVFWVALDVGKYLIQGFNTVPYALFKFFIVIGLIVYGFFIMRLSFQGRDIRKYIARIGEVSVVNIATILFIQDLLPAFTTGIQLLELVLGFVLLYSVIDLVLIRFVKRFWVKREVREEVPEEAPRIKRVIPPEEKPAPPAEEEPIEEAVPEETVPPTETVPPAETVPPPAPPPALEETTPPVSEETQAPPEEGV